MAHHPLRLRSAVAVRIADIDRLKFNEAVASGHYPCAPKTVAGSARLFSEDDVVLLYIFARLMEKGYSTRSAGALVCDMRGFLRDKKGNEISRITHVQGRLTDFFIPSENYDPEHERNGTCYPGAGDIIWASEFNLVTIRRLVREGIVRERATIGIEGDDD